MSERVQGAICFGIIAFLLLELFGIPGGQSPRKTLKGEGEDVGELLERMGVPSQRESNELNHNQ